MKTREDILKLQQELRDLYLPTKQNVIEGIISKIKDVEIEMENIIDMVQVNGEITEKMHNALSVKNGKIMKLYNELYFELKGII